MPQMFRGASAPAAPPQFQPGESFARELRFASAASSYDPESHTVEGVFAAGSAVRRFGFVEVLNMDPSAVDLSRVAQQQCKLLNSHNSYDIGNILGVVEEARIEGGRLVGRVRFAQTPQGQLAEGMVARDELNGFSVGYSITRWVMVQEDDTGLQTWRADQWTLLEVSLCATPADPASSTRGVEPSASHPREEEDDMTRSAAPAAPAAAVENPAPPAAAPAAHENRSAPPAPSPAATPAAAPAQTPAERAAPTGLTGQQAILLAQRAEYFGQRELAERMIGEGLAEQPIMDAVMAAARAAAQASGGNHHIGGPRATIGRDESETRRLGMEDALAIRLGENAQPNEAARQYMDARDLVDLAADRIDVRRVPHDFAAREDLLRRALQSTSDFPILLENALNRALRARYVVAEPTYRRIAQQRTYVDFRDHISVRDGDFPQLKEVKETGELQAGTFSESKEKTAVKAYGVRVGFSRQLLVNDNLGSIQRVLNSRATAVARFEEETFYAMMLSATGAGPTLIETGRAVFNTTDKTLAAAAGAIGNPTLGIGRAALRGMKTKDGTLLNIAPSILLVGPDKETEAQGVLSPLYAAVAANVPIFQNQLSLLVSAQITGNPWYLFADPAMGANFEWGLLEGYAAPRMRIDEPFGRQGMEVSLEHDFGCGAIDYRFGFRNAGL
ncbi:hypothetical protein A1351_15485 [Methylosinus sp. R-45379]|uniref:phage major capsid protein n=1 Tax=Methylosinus sp. R-45379 TaxID=980563 RepID=UPI0007C956F1|nr:HK97 family phage prohead protease [Methylosinus sp. R-45379]OAI25954.1 hypothetical protein A1351_15485 [Methylosinus sp. R-45379]